MNKLQKLTKYLEEFSDKHKTYFSSDILYEKTTEGVYIALLIALVFTLIDFIKNPMYQLITIFVLILIFGYSASSVKIKNTTPTPQQPSSPKPSSDKSAQSSPQD